MSHGALLTFVGISLAFIGLALTWWYIYPRPSSVIEYTSEMTTWNFSFRSFVKSLDPPVMTTEDVLNTAWADEMRLCGAAMERSHVRFILFVDGTYHGASLPGVLDTVKNVYPLIKKNLARRTFRSLKRQQNQISPDNDHFSADYISAFKSGIGPQFEYSKFQWRRENHHFARLKAAADLTMALGTYIKDKHLNSESRILLIAQGQGGQIFALLAQLVEFDLFGRSLIEILRESGENVAKLNSALNSIRTITLDFVTCGTPVLYSWPDSGYYRLLHLINHRGSSHLAPRLGAGMLYTRAGDYIQQLGILGIDVIANTPAERKLNKKLDEIFGKGRNLKLWKKNIEKRMRVPPSGKTFLIDYADSAAETPNFVGTFFGHGAYTRRETMLFNTRLIAEYFYRLHSI